MDKINKVLRQYNCDPDDDDGMEEDNDGEKLEYNDDDYDY